ncbi:MAG TPA: 2,3-diphosphoglycerate synthetase [Coriobacteriia bacterium]
MRVLALIDGEHYPPVVRAALATLAEDHEVVAAVFAGGTEKVGHDASADAYGLPVVRGASAIDALATALVAYAPEAVVDLSDEPVLTADDRFQLASVALAAGAEYIGADFRFVPQVAEVETVTPALAIVGTGKRVGKTAISAHAARLLTAHGSDVAVVAMGRGGPERPEVIHGESVTLTTADLLALARKGVHAASDCYEDAIMARVTTVGCRRCGGGMAGATFFGNVAEGALVADGLGKDLLLLEGSGAAVPPVYADATVLVVGAAQGPSCLTGYFGPLRLASADLVAVAGAEYPIAGPALVDATLAAARAARADVPVVPVVFRPRPLERVAGKRVLFATTAPVALLPILASHLETEHGCDVVAMSAGLSDRGRLLEDLRAAAGRFDVLLTELKAAAIDVVAEAGDAAGVPVVLCDNVPHGVTCDLDGALRDVAALAVERGQGRCADGE